MTRQHLRNRSAMGSLIATSSSCSTSSLSFIYSLEKKKKNYWRDSEITVTGSWTKKSMKTTDKTKEDRELVGYVVCSVGWLENEEFWMRFCLCTQKKIVNPLRRRSVVGWLNRSLVLEFRSPGPILEQGKRRWRYVFSVPLTSLTVWV